MAYTNVEDYNAFMGIPYYGISYEKSEYEAINFLEDYCVAFPSLEEWQTLDLVKKDLIEKAIFYQISYLLENPNLVTGENKSSQSFSLGKYSVQETAPSNEDSQSPVCEISKKNMDKTGICRRINCGGCQCT